MGAAVTKPSGRGWQSWMFRPTAGPQPLDYVELELWREEWPETRLVRPEEMPPEMNVAGLYWRPAGPLRRWR